MTGWEGQARGSLGGLLTLRRPRCPLGHCPGAAGVRLPGLSVGTHPGHLCPHCRGHPGALWHRPVPASLHRGGEFIVPAHPSHGQVGRVTAAGPLAASCPRNHQNMLEAQDSAASAVPGWAVPGWARGNHPPNGASWLPGLGSRFPPSKSPPKVLRKRRSSPRKKELSSPSPLPPSLDFLVRCVGGRLGHLECLHYLLLPGRGGTREGE